MLYPDKLKQSCGNNPAVAVDANFSTGQSCHSCAEDDDVAQLASAEVAEPGRDCRRAFFRLSEPRSLALPNHFRSSSSISFLVALVVAEFRLTAPKQYTKATNSKFIELSHRKLCQACNACSANACCCCVCYC